MMKTLSPPALALMLLLLAPWLVGCAEDTDDSGVGSVSESAVAPGEVPDGVEVVTRTQTVGPVETTVRVWPEAPTLGDPVTLELEVVAEPGVEVTMPAFGDQLGRFGIVEFVPRRGVDPTTGATRWSQRYVLDLPMSGRQRIPSLLVEFVDGRAGQDADAIQEILTEDIALEVASLTGADIDALRPVRDALPELDDDREAAAAQRWLWALLGVVVVGGLVATVWLARRRERQVRVDAWAVAMEQLAELEAREVPETREAVDAWWVDLSAVVRHYIEARYGLRAPELTTEEFLRQARNADVLDVAHRDQLAGLLERADRVKFAAWMPDAEQSRDALTAARRFVEETRIRDQGSGVRDQETPDLSPT